MPIIKKRKSIIILGMMIVFAGMVYVALPYFHVKHDRTLEVSLNEKVKDEHTNTVFLGDLITYDWKRAHLFHPYTEEADMK
ncbi:hypothetical protein [Terribacillus sp. FSL K6-0262]|uniref:hypothetical protein n=1 Tax=Terribacillus sp. FSL K6-0262 TaxID=2921447 RepID=UPI0030EB3003